MTDLFVLPARLDRWTANFLARHGATALNVAGGALIGFGQDGSSFEARLPFGRAYDGPATTADVTAAARAPEDWGLLLVRKGGFAVARAAGTRITDSKVGRRHVQGRTKAGGQSQQRFARRRDNQAREAYLAAAGHATRLLDGVPLLVTGGDALALRAVLEETGLGASVAATLPDVREPRRGVFEEAVLDAASIRIRVHNADDGHGALRP
ncbi:MAG: acVLRF1 family peptidyl-tRNA hydrolase [Marmoricola sp.]